MIKFYYNPISMNDKTIHLFPNVKTLHLYNKSNEILKGIKTQVIIDWRVISLHKSLKIRELRFFKFNFKLLLWKETNSEEEYKKNDKAVWEKY